MTKKSSKSKMTDQTALSYGFGKTTLGKILVAPSDKGVVSILTGGSNAKLLSGLQSRFPDAHLMRSDKEASSFVKSVEKFVEDQQYWISFATNHARGPTQG